MAQITYRANLSAKSFPFISDNWGRSVIVAQYDNTFNRQVASQEDADKDVGIPQAYYMHNVVPVAQGFQSIGYSTILTASPVANFTSIQLIRDASDVKAYLGVTATGVFYINRGTGWVAKDTYTAGAQVYTAYVSGITYIYIAGYGCVRYDFAADAFVAVTFLGLDATKIIGVTGAFGYLIAWSSPIAFTAIVGSTVSGSAVLTVPSSTGVYVNQPVSGTNIPIGATVISTTPTTITISVNATATGGGITFAFNSMAAAVAWSSVIDPTDFIPSLVTGAGGGSVEGAKGAITVCIAHTLGFIVYTTANAVAAVYTNNSRYPFTFREILSSGGLASQDLVGYDANSGNHYAYTTSGLQLVSTNQTQTLYPEVTDFISGRLFEDYNESTDTFSRSVLTSAMNKKVAVISDRYIVLSYGVSSLTHALVYDISMKRWGKLKIPHVAVIEYQLISAGVFEIPKQSIALLQVDGTVKIVDFSAYSATSYGVIALGKYQFVRARTLQLDEIAIENVYNTTTFQCRILSSLDGKNVSTSLPTVLDSGGNYIHYGCRAIGINHSLVCKGSFLLESLVLSFNIHGKR